MTLVVPFEEIFEDQTKLLAKHDSWERVELGEVCEVLNGFAFKSTLFNGSEGFPIIRIRDLARGRTETFYKGEYPSEYVVETGDLLVGMDGNFGCYEWTGGKALLNQRVCKLGPRERYLHRKFLLFCINGYLKAIQDATSSVTVGHLSSRDIQKIPFPLPPLNEQHRIVAKLEKLLSRVDAAQARLATTPRILKRFRQSVLAAACSGRLTVDWHDKQPDAVSVVSLIEAAARSAGEVRTRRGVPETVELSEQIASFELPPAWALVSTAELLRTGVLLDVKDGNHGSNHPKVADFTPEGLPFITAAQVRNYEIDYEGAPKISGKPLEELRVGFAEIGDAILTHKGSVGRAALNTQPCVLTPQTTYYRCNTSVLLPSYLVYHFTSWQFFIQLNAVMSQTTRDFVPISEQYNLFIVVPPIEEQQEIVRRVDALFKTADVLEARYLKAKAHVDKLTQSILARALRGELVSTEAELARREGRDYEPASVLLERIRQERAQQATSTKPKPKQRRAARKKAASSRDAHAAPDPPASAKNSLPSIRR